MDERNLKEHLKNTLDIGEYEIYDGVVTEVNEGENTISVALDEEVTIEDVKLRAASDGNSTGLILVPAKDSYVVFAKVRGEMDYVLLKTTELDKIIIEVGISLTGKIPTVDLKCENVNLEVKNIVIKAEDTKIDSNKIVMNGGNNMGLAKVQSITERLNLIEQDLTIAKAAVTSWAVTPMDGGLALKTALTPWAGAALVPTMPMMLENDAVKH